MKSPFMMGHFSVCFLLLYVSFEAILSRFLPFCYAYREAAGPVFPAVSLFAGVFPPSVMGHLGLCCSEPCKRHGRQCFYTLLLSIFAVIQWDVTPYSAFAVLLASLAALHTGDGFLPEKVP